MQVPKRKHSKSRTRKKRNSHYVREAINTVVCKSCGNRRLPHVVCGECGSK